MVPENVTTLPSTSSPHQPKVGRHDQPVPFSPTWHGISLVDPSSALLPSLHTMVETQFAPQTWRGVPHFKSATNVWLNNDVSNAVRGAKASRSYCNGTMAPSTAPRQSCKGFFFLPPEMRAWQSRTRRGVKDKGEGTCSNGANCMVPSVAWSIHTLLLLPFYAEKRRVGGLSTWPPVRAGGGSYQPEFRMCRVVVRRVENSCLRTFKPAWKQGIQTEQKWGQTCTPCRFFGCEELCLSLRVGAGGYSYGRYQMCARQSPACVLHQ